MPSRLRGAGSVSTLHYRGSGSFGRSKIDYRLDDTINASLGPLSPTSFDAGSRQQTDTIANLDFVYRWQTVERKYSFIVQFNSPDLSMLSIEDPGLAVLSARSGVPMFTDGYRHWALTARGPITWDGDAPETLD